MMIGDAAALQSWQGSRQEIEHSEKIVNFLNTSQYGLQIEVEGHPVVIWDINGPGTIDIFSQSGDNICLVRAWLSDDGDMPEIESLCALPIGANEIIGEITIESGCLALIWSGESGSCIRVSRDGHYSLDTNEMMSDTSGLIVTLSSGIYRCTADEVRTDTAEARRCHIVRLS